MRRKVLDMLHRRVWFMFHRFRLCDELIGQPSFVSCELDVLGGTGCGGRMRVIAFIELAEAMRLHRRRMIENREPALESGWAKVGTLVGTQGQNGEAA